MAHPAGRRLSALLKRAQIETSSGFVAEKRSGPRYWKQVMSEPFLLKTTWGATRSAHGR